MKNDFVFTQVKEVVMTSEKTVTIITKKLEKDDGSGMRKLVGNTQTKSVEYHNPELNVGRAA